MTNHKQLARAFVTKCYHDNVIKYLVLHYWAKAGRGHKVHPPVLARCVNRAVAEIYGGKAWPLFKPKRPYTARIPQGVTSAGKN